MNAQVETSTVSMMLIQGVPRLDPIRALWLNDAPGKGRVIIHCYDKVWTSYWNAMGGNTVEEFFQRVDVDYLVNNLIGSKRVPKHEQAYIAAIVEAVQCALKQPTVIA